MKILVIEDDEFLAQTLVSILTSQNYAIDVAADGQAGQALVETFDYDLVMLDVMLPKLDGISLCRQIRAKGLQVPILLLTGRDSGHDKAIGLDAGADDYVVKPFDQEELVARVRALLRRGVNVAQPVLEWGALRLDPSICEVTYDAKPLPLTPKEYALLELFLRNHRRVFSCGMILEHLWTYEETPGEEAVRTHIKGLRQKLKIVGLPTDVIETVYGIGYRLKPKVPREKTQLKVPEPQSLQKASRIPQTKLRPLDSQNQSSQNQSTLDNSREDEPKPQQVSTNISQIWHQFKQRINQQVAVLERAITHLGQQELAQGLRQQASQEAHTLAGALGTFGLPQGSHLARQIEQTLQTERPLAQDEVVNLREWVIALRQVIEQSQNNITSPPQAAISPANHQLLLLIVDQDRALAQKLATIATTWGFRTKLASCLTDASDIVLLESPDVVLLDPVISPTMEASFAWLADLRKQAPPIPAAIFTAQDDLAERLKIARLGGRSFIPKSTPLPQVLETVHQLVRQAERTKAKVLVVDDDPTLLALVRKLLEPWGLKITTLADPQQFWQQLEATAPDLLILDIEMPQISGIELCQIVRHDSHWGTLPILFLTAHTDAETVDQVFSVGADDFVSKPIVGSELVTRIINRLERLRLARLANWQRSTQDCTQNWE